jgi:GTP-binding protein
MDRPDTVVDLTFDLFDKLGASEEQLDFPYLYAVARDGVAIRDLNDEHKDITPLLDLVLEQVKPADQNIETDFMMQPATLAFDNYVGRIAVGRVYSGQIKPNQEVTVIKPNGEKRKKRITKIFKFAGMQKIETDIASAGDIVAIAGIDDIFVSETITDNENAEPLEAIKVDPPALAIEFMVNDSPLAGKEGKFVTSRHILERLERELETNVGLKIERKANSDAIKVYGRGEMHIAVLIETMRREGFELQISQPEVIMQEIDGQKQEPFENVVINVPDEMSGSVIEAISKRKGIMQNMVSDNGTTQLEFVAPTRGLLGFRSVFILLTKGEGTFYHSFSHEPYCGAIEKRQVGSMISQETGTALAFALYNLQPRGPIFIHPQTEVYEGMIIGEHNQGTDLTVNPLKGKKLTNVRASGTDDAIALTPPVEITLEKAIEYIADDEYAEITPSKIRLRKKFLKEHERKRGSKS